MNRTPALLSDALYEISHPVQQVQDLQPLVDFIGDSRVVLIGEASHGTSDYYLWRARLTQRLIEEKGFSFVAVEGDWPDCYRVNRYAKGYESAGTEAYDVLYTFDRWPTWMWANWEIVAFITWLRGFNERLPLPQRVGFYGLDVYSLWESMDAIIHYLQDVDPQAVEIAYQAYMCFEPYERSEQEYARATAMVPATCEDEVIDLLVELRRRLPSYPEDHEDRLNAEQNAQVMIDAERYYRAMVRSSTDSWNVRDQHMADTLDRLLRFHGPSAKAVIWEHNTHIGDARATTMAAHGQFNVGQLARQQYGRDTVTLVGFGSHRGSVIASHQWGAPMERMPVPEAQEDSWEHILHQMSGDNRLLLLPPARQDPALMQQRGHRAIGVVYHPEYEQFGNYVPTVLPERYDAFIYLDETHALHPLHVPQTDTQQPPETYPWGV